MDWIRVRLLVRTFEQFQISDADAGHKKEKNCNVQLEKRVSLDILSVKNLTKLSAREMPRVEVGNGDEDLQ